MVVSLERACSIQGWKESEICNGAVKTPFFSERQRRRRLLLNKIKYRVIVAERRKAAIRRSLSTLFKTSLPFSIFHPSFQASFARPEISFSQGWRCFSTGGPRVCGMRARIMNFSRRGQRVSTMRRCVFLHRNFFPSYRKRRML